jgi:hypothetical protein
MNAERARGMDKGAILRQFALRALTAEEEETAQAMVRESGTSLCILPTHHIDAWGDFQGFRYTCPAQKTAVDLPISKQLFFGHTATECEEHEDAIIRLMSTPVANQSTLRRVLQDIAEECQPPTLDCIPENASFVTAAPDGRHAVTCQASGMKTMDSAHWTPETPDSIGIYHAYVRTCSNDVRVHRLFIACSGGAAKATDSFCNMVFDIGADCTVAEIAESEEAWWLRKASQRMRCRLIKRVADAFNLRIPTLSDIQSHHPCTMAVPTVDTIEHDITRTTPTHVSVFSHACDTTKVQNGMLVAMSPSEGYWLFRGRRRVSGQGGTHGGMFGSAQRCGVFPTRAPVLQGTAPGRDAQCVVRRSQTLKRDAYQQFDEAFFKNLETMEWNRDNGFVELIPIVVAVA